MGTENAKWFLTYDGKAYQVQGTYTVSYGGGWKLECVEPKKNNKKKKYK